MVYLGSMAYSQGLQAMAYGLRQGVKIHMSHSDFCFITEDGTVCVGARVRARARVYYTYFMRACSHVSYCLQPSLFFSRPPSVPPSLSLSLPPSPSLPLPPSPSLPLSLPLSLSPSLSLPLSLPLSLSRRRGEDFTRDRQIASTHKNPERGRPTRPGEILYKVSRAIDFASHRKIEQKSGAGTRHAPWRGGPPGA